LRIHQRLSRGKVLPRREALHYWRRHQRDSAPRNRPAVVEGLGRGSHLARELHFAQTITRPMIRESCGWVVGMLRLRRDSATLVATALCMTGSDEWPIQSKQTKSPRKSLVLRIKIRPVESNRKPGDSQGGSHGHPGSNIPAQSIGGPQAP